MRIAVDGMGGDAAPRVIVDGIKAAFRREEAEGSAPELKILLVGDPEVLKKHLGRKWQRDPRISLVPASEVIGMNDSPATYLRKKPDSSIRVGINLLGRGEADAFFSAGNSGAVMATASMVLRRNPGVDRPAIAAVMPGREGGVVLLDLGANVDCRPIQLFQFAVMGSGYCRFITRKEKPRVGLINNGEEEEKGNYVIRKAHALLKESSLNYIGFVEGQDIYTAKADVLVCDGMLGNVILKSAEGLTETVEGLLKEQIGHNPLSWLGFLFIRGAYRRMRKTMDYRKHGGAPLLGVNGVVLVGHGRSNVEAVQNGIHQADRLAAEGFTDYIARELQTVTVRAIPEESSPEAAHGTGE